MQLQTHEKVQGAANMGLDENKPSQALHTVNLDRRQNDNIFTWPICLIKTWLSLYSPNSRTVSQKSTKASFQGCTTNNLQYTQAVMQIDGPSLNWNTKRFMDCCSQTGLVLDEEHCLRTYDLLNCYDWNGRAIKIRDVMVDWPDEWKMSQGWASLSGSCTIPKSWEPAPLVQLLILCLPWSQAARHKWRTVSIQAYSTILCPSVLWPIWTRTIIMAFNEASCGQVLICSWKGCTETSTQQPLKSHGMRHSHQYGSLNTGIYVCSIFFWIMGEC